MAGAAEAVELVEAEACLAFELALGGERVAEGVEPREGGGAGAGGGGGEEGGGAERRRLQLEAEETLGAEDDAVAVLERARRLEELAVDEGERVGRAGEHRRRRAARVGLQRHVTSAHAQAPQPRRRRLGAAARRVGAARLGGAGAAAREGPDDEGGAGGDQDARGRRAARGGEQIDQRAAPRRLGRDGAAKRGEQRVRAARRPRGVGGVGDGDGARGGGAQLGVPRPFLGGDEGAQPPFELLHLLHLSYCVYLLGVAAAVGARDLERRRRLPVQLRRPPRELAQREARRRPPRPRVHRHLARERAEAEGRDRLGTQRFGGAEGDDGDEESAAVECLAHQLHQRVGGARGRRARRLRRRRRIVAARRRLQRRRQRGGRRLYAEGLAQRHRRQALAAARLEALEARELDEAQPRLPLLAVPVAVVAVAVAVALRRRARRRRAGGGLAPQRIDRMGGDDRARARAGLARAAADVADLLGGGGGAQLRQPHEEERVRARGALVEVGGADGALRLAKLTERLRLRVAAHRVPAPLAAVGDGRLRRRRARHARPARRRRVVGGRQPTGGWSPVRSLSGVRGSRRGARRSYTWSMCTSSMQGSRRSDASSAHRAHSARSARAARGGARPPCRPPCSPCRRRSARRRAPSRRSRRGRRAAARRPPRATRPPGPSAARGRPRTRGRFASV